MNELQLFEEYKRTPGPMPTEREFKEQAKALVNTCPDRLTTSLLDEEDSGENGPLKKRMQALIRYVVLIIGIMTLATIGCAFDAGAPFFGFVGGVTLLALLILSYVCRSVLRKYAKRLLHNLWETA